MAGEQRDGEASPAPRAEEEQQALAILDAATSTRSMTVLERERMEMRTVFDWGRMMYASGFFPDARSAAQAAVKILSGRELGFTVMQSMTGFHVIDGKVVAGANLMAHAIKRSGRYDYRILEHNDLICSIQFYERRAADFEPAGPPSVFTIEDAQIANLVKPGSGWQKYPRNMLFARALSNGVAWYAPDVFGVRVYTAEEIRPGLDIDADGAVVDIESVVTSPRTDSGDPDNREQPRQAPQGQRPPPGNRPPPRPPQQRAQGPQVPQRKTRDLELKDVWNVQTLLTWQREQWQGDSRDVCTALGVEGTGQIAAKYGPDEDGYRKAGEILWNHFDPESYAAHIVRVMDDSPADDAEAAAVQADDAPASVPGAADIEKTAPQFLSRCLTELGIEPSTVYEGLGVADYDGMVDRALGVGWHVLAAELAAKHPRPDAGGKEVTA